MGRRESVVYGVNAALAVAIHRPESIRRVFHNKARRKVLGPLLKATAAAHRPYREVEDEDLRKLSSSTHHEGVVVVTDPLQLAPLSALLPAESAPVIVLDRIGNPHNLGAVLRSAAWFGAAGVVITRDPNQASLSAAAVRIAQGGAELVPVAGVDDLPAALRELAAGGYTVLAAEQHKTARSFKGPAPQPLCLVFGNERDGLSPRVRAACSQSVAIPGTGRIESLNVSVAVGILLAWAMGASGG